MINQLHPQKEKTYPHIKLMIFQLIKTKITHLELTTNLI